MSIAYSRFFVNFFLLFCHPRISGSAGRGTRRGMCAGRPARGKPRDHRQNKKKSQITEQPNHGASESRNHLTCCSPNHRITRLPNLKNRAKIKKVFLDKIVCFVYNHLHRQGLSERSRRKSATGFESLNRNVRLVRCRCNIFFFDSFVCDMCPWRNWQTPPPQKRPAHEGCRFESCRAHQS